MGSDYPYPRAPMLPRRLRVTIVGLLFLTWSLTFTTLSNDKLPLVKPTPSSDWTQVRKLTCTDTFWDPDTCGMDGVNCEPFSGQLVPFQCPSNCLRDGVITGKPHLVGGQEITGQPLVIGGPIYRGDSYICPAAVHAGVVADADGGCGVARYMGMTNSFSSSYMYDVESLDVQTYFPMTFRFTVESEDMACPHVTDASWALPYVSAVHTALVWRTTGSKTTRSLWALAVTYAHLSLRPGARRWVRSWVSPTTPAPATAPAARARDGDVSTPQVLEPVIFQDSISNITFKWATPIPDGVEGISMMVDDVERARRFFGKGAKNNQLKDGEDRESFFWQRTPQAFVDYIRFGYIKNGKVLKYSQPGTWFTNGTWSGIPASK